MRQNPLRPRPGRFCDRRPVHTCQVWLRTCPVLCLTILMLLTACAAPPATPIPPTDTPRPTAAPTPSRTPASTDEVDGTLDAPGWRPKGESRRYDRETLFDLVDGAADLYFSYGFVDVTVTQYLDDAGQTAQVEVYHTATDADAYGLYTYHSYGEPVELGIDGERDPGYRLAFWQGQAFVQIVGREAVDDDALWALGRAAAASLPPGGARPALVGVLPTEDRQPGSVRFFREKLALDNLLWLGTDDLLGLGPDIEGVVARYEIEGQAADLLLVSFPDAARAERAQTALEVSQVEGLVATRLSDRLLGAVFGSLSFEAADMLLAKTLNGDVQARAAALTLLTSVRLALYNSRIILSKESSNMP